MAWDTTWALIGGLCEQLKLLLYTVLGQSCLIGGNVQKLLRMSPFQQNNTDVNLHL